MSFLSMIEIIEFVTEFFSIYEEEKKSKKSTIQRNSSSQKMNKIDRIPEESRSTEKSTESLALA